MFKSPQNIKAAGGLPVLWVHFPPPPQKKMIQGLNELRASLWRWLMMIAQKKASRNISVKFNPEAHN